MAPTRLKTYSTKLFNLRQQLGRMDMVLDDMARIPEDTRPHRLSARCSGTSRPTPG